MTPEQMIKKLTKYIESNYETQSKYASHKGFSVAHINAILMGTKDPTKDILNDIGLVKSVEKIKIVSYQNIG